MKIANSILLSFAAIEILFGIATYVNYKQAALVRSNSERFQQSTLIVRNSNRLQRNILSIVGGLRGYLLTNELFFIQSYDSGVMENEQILIELQANLRPDAEQQQLLEEIKTLSHNLVNDFAEPLLEAKRISGLSDSTRNAYRTLQQASILKGLNQSTIDLISRKVMALINSEYRFREAERQRLADSVEKTTSISLSLIVFAFVGGAGIAWFLAMYISSRIRETVAMANSVAKGNYEERLTANPNNEFGQLADSLNNMSAILAKNIALLTRRNEELNQFAHIVSHDMKAPLRGIDNVVSWIEEDHHDELPKKVREYLLLIKSRITRAENLLRGILAYSRIGREQPDYSLVNVNQLITEIASYLPKDTAITLHVQPGLPTLRTERVLLLQVFSNLILNAFKHHDKPNGFVSVKCRETIDNFEFSIRDNGPGIDPTYHERIFMIFETLGDKDSTENTGVGLAIVKKILSDRGLKITIDSAPGEGSTFTFQWPKDYGKTS